MGGDGLSQASQDAVPSANSLRKQLEDDLEMPADGPCMLEFVASAHGLTVHNGVRALDIAKALLDRNFYAPTVYFPLVVPEAIMIEPTETESKETLDAFAEALLRIRNEDAEFLHQAPHTLGISRPDEVRAAKEPILRWKQPVSVAPVPGAAIP